MAFLSEYHCAALLALIVKSDVPLREPESKNHLGRQLQALLLEDDEEFVEAAYLVLLQRRPDANGGRVYLRELRNGTNKLQVLFELANSNESRFVGASLPGLAEACAREGIGQPKIDGQKIVPPSTVAGISRAEQLLAQDDYEKLIELAYWVLLKRAPDPEGIAIYLEKLRGDTSKTKFLHDIFTSPECKNLGTELPGLIEMFERENLPVLEAAAPPLVISATDATTTRASTPLTLTELLSLHGEDFVAIAHEALLDSPAEAASLERHTSELLAGTSKMQILSRIVEAAGVRGKRDLPGLASGLMNFKRSRLPVVGVLFRTLGGVEGDSALERRSRAVEQRQFMYESDFIGRIAQLETKIAELNAVGERASSATNLIAERIASLEKSASLLRHFVQATDLQSAQASKVSTLEIPKSLEGFVVELRALEVARDLKQRQQ